MLRKFSVLLFLICCSLGFTQKTAKLSDLSEISIITSGPGNALYEKFGHTAIRVKDPMLELDLIYNYGMFDFDAPNFILNFTKGYMKYKLARYPFHYAVKNTQDDKRWMKQQILNLTTEEKNLFFKFLENNALPKNASYFYDPFFDNCATRPVEIINKIIGKKVIWDDSYTSNSSFRELMNKEINQNTWGSIGINIALGSILDRKAEPLEYLYLPDYVEKALDRGKIRRDEIEDKLVKKKEVILNFDEKLSKTTLISPFLVFSILCLIFGYSTFIAYKNNYRNKWIDFTLLFLTGFTGIVILFLWFFTNHSTAPNNYNLLWAFPLNIIVAFYSIKRNPPKWIAKYILFLLILSLVIPIIWFAKIQLFNWAIAPLFLLLAIRFLLLYKTLKG